jgi:hypothetical protein
MLNLFQHPLRGSAVRVEGWTLKQVQGDVLGGATNGLNAPPGTAAATGLSKPSLLTDETPNTQSSTRTLPRTIVQGDPSVGEHKVTKVSLPS